MPAPSGTIPAMTGPVGETAGAGPSGVRIVGAGVSVVANWDVQGAQWDAEGAYWDLTQSSVEAPTGNIF